MFVLTSAVRGGVEEVVLGLLQRLDPSEFRLSLAAPPALLGALGPDLAGIGLDTLAVEVESLLHIPQVNRLLAFMRRVRPDVVNPHLFRSTAVAAPVARAAGIRGVVETYHGREAWRQGLCAGASPPTASSRGSSPASSRSRGAPPTFSCTARATRRTRSW